MTVPDLLVVLRLAWPFLAGGAVLGIATGGLAWTTGAPRPAGKLAGVLALLATAAGIGVAAARVLPDRAGFALELAVALALAFWIGLALGAAGRRAAAGRQRSADWS